MDFNAKESQIILNHFVDRVNVGVLELSLNDKVIDYNPYFEKMIDFKENIKGISLDEIFTDIVIKPLEGIDKNYFLKEIKCNYKSYYGSSISLNGEIIEYEKRKFVFFENFLIIESDIIEEISGLNIEMANLLRERNKKNKDLKKANAKINTLLNIDYLTKVFNRKYFFERLNEFISLKKRSNDFEISIIFIDIDNFKKVNDNYGHEIGDTVLVKFSELLMSSTRADDVVARLGGEEFCIISRCQKKEDVLKLSERIRSNCKKIKIEGVPDPITVSLGATLYKKWEDLNKVVKRADENMYSAKIQGRDRIIFKE